MADARHTKVESSWDRYVRTGGRCLPARVPRSLPATRVRPRSPDRKPPTVRRTRGRTAAGAFGVGLLFVAAYALFLYEQDVLALSTASVGLLAILVTARAPS